jgi:hypothetical protein
LFPANLFTELGNEEHELNEWGPEQLGLSQGKKLRTLIVGLNESNDTLKTDLSVSNSPLLEKLDVANLTVYTGDLNLTP